MASKHFDTLFVILSLISASVWAVNKPTIYLPNSTMTFPPKTTFRWEHKKGNTKYLLEIDTIDTFSSSGKITSSKTCSATTSDRYLEKDIENLYLGCSNYFRVRAICNKDTSEWSNTRQFCITSKAIASSPNGAVDVAIPETLRWVYQSGFPKSVVEVDTTTSFSHPIVHADRTTPNSTWAYQSVSNLKYGTTYYWRMRNYHDRAATEWSDTLTFTTMQDPQPTPLQDNYNDNRNDNQTRKQVIDGRLYIIKDAKRYDATGFTRD